MDTVDQEHGGLRPRRRRAAVEDLWRKRDGSPSARAGRGLRWRARYVDDTGTERSQAFERKVDAQRWLDAVTASLIRGDHVTPRSARMTVGEWADTWLAGYSRRASTIRQAEVHIKVIKATFGRVPLSAVKPSDVKHWTKTLKVAGRSDSYVYALHSRLSQLFSDAVHDGIMPRNPCSRRTSPGTGKPRPYVATTAQVWALYYAVPDGIRPAILLGAHAGLRLAEAAALRPEDIDFMRGIVSPVIQWPAEPLKSDASRTPIPIPNELALELSAAVAAGEGLTIVTNELGRPAGPWAIERAMREARVEIEGLPAGFRFHDLRHYFASLLIASGLDVKTVQARVRHASAKTTLDTYGHLWPDRDESSRAAVAAVYAARSDSPAYPLRTGDAEGGQ
ncbi:site-specific integrase [Jatrophihabitans cynanchi]|jgi:integrase|uniref:Site-specific integrase n=1 Tax=Jatrophihabitans cynanchi TaxID=2944128 RepID=A0ABY7JZ30_9ACTN|nr:site-specific integrase [Jatrophihabitans sp. SB3-54]WAX56602.1 site-specific integrase [Jatrophihabitans sp. SB3-54]